MSGHPLALIAGMSDGIDVGRLELLEAHVASCDACRTYARTIERVDRLIASPEPALALPPRAAAETPRGYSTSALVIVAAAFFVAVALWFGRQTVHETAAPPAWTEMVAVGNDACDLLPARRVVHVPQPPSDAFPSVPPVGASAPFQGECAYGYHEGWFALRLLIRTELTAPAEALEHWRAFAAAQNPPLTTWSTVETSGPGGLAAVRWSTNGMTAGRAWSVMGVYAKSYFFVVIAETSGAARQVVDAVLDKLNQRPASSEAWRSSACTVIDQAAVQGGLSVGPGAQVASLFPHLGYNSTVFGNNICAYGRDVWWDDPHLFLRARFAAHSDVQPLLADSLSLIGAPPSVEMERMDEWTLVDQSLWLAHVRTPDGRGWSAVAGLSGSEFFMVFFDTDDKAIRLARAVATELKR